MALAERRERREEKYYEILTSTCSQNDWFQICAKAVDQAKRGDAVARKFIADYLIGQPVQKQEVTGFDGGAVEIVVTYENRPPVTESA